MYKIISLCTLNLHKCYMLIIFKILKEKQKINVLNCKRQKKKERKKEKIDQIMARSKRSYLITHIPSKNINNNVGEIMTNSLNIFFSVKHICCYFFLQITQLLIKIKCSFIMDSLAITGKPKEENLNHYCKTTVRNK